MSERFQVAFRVDASLEIGSGHVMRCLTLADALKLRGANSVFICRSHLGNLFDVIKKRGYRVIELESTNSNSQSRAEVYERSYEAWLGTNWQTDAEDCRSLLAQVRPDWLIIDHYGIDAKWVREIDSGATRIMVIDDLADRQYDCTLLVDQNLGRSGANYESLTNLGCKILAGHQFALLNQEFSRLRSYSLARRVSKPVKSIMVTMGGVDASNATSVVLNTLKECPLRSETRITVVMGAAAPHIAEIKALAATMPWPTTVLSNIDDMAQRMADSDLAIGAAGSTSWERCCLGVPTLMVVLAENQLPISHALEKEGAAYLLGNIFDIPYKLPLALSEIDNENALSQMSGLAAKITDGLGIKRVIDAMESEWKAS